VRSLIVVFLSLLTVPGVRAAEQPSDVATAHVRKATAAYNLGKYDDAAKEYEAAYEQTLDPNLLFNLGQTCRLAGNREKALTAYRSFIRSAPDSPQRPLAESKIRELERQRSTPPPAPEPVPAAEPAAPAAASAATPALPAAAPVVPPSTEPPSLPSAPAPAPSATETPSNLVAAPVAPEPAPSTPFYKGWPFWTAVGAVVAGAVVLTVVLTRPSNNLNMNTKFGTQGF
jgi:tetratricopeptide (TPR) repeat protein